MQSEISYTGSYELDEKALEDGSALDEHFGAIGGWITSALVRLGDLPLTFLPAGGSLSVAVDRIGTTPGGGLPPGTDPDGGD